MQESPFADDARFRRDLESAESIFQEQELKTISRSASENRKN